MLDVAPTRDALKVAQSVRERRPARCLFTAALSELRVHTPSSMTRSFSCQNFGLSPELIAMLDAQLETERQRQAAVRDPGWAGSHAAMVRHALRPTCVVCTLYAL